MKHYFTSYTFSVSLAQPAFLAFSLSRGVKPFFVFLIGLLYSYFKHKVTTASVLPLLLMTGVLGGFTTFSTFSLETIQLLQQNEYLKTILYVVGSVGLGLTACFWGIRQF